MSEKHTGKFVCQNCGDSITMDEPTEPWDCAGCGGEMLPVDENEVVPIEALADLVAQWRERYEVDEPMMAAKDRMKRYQANECADELQEVIDDYRSEQ